MGQSTRQRKEILLSNGVYRTLAKVESFLLRDRLLQRTARNGREILGRARRACPDVVILEHALPDLSVIDVCAALKTLANGERRPVVIVAGPARPRDIAAQCLAAGCDHYIASRRSPARILKETASALHLRDRRHARHPAVMPVAVGRVASEFLGYSRDISKGGVLIESALKVERGRRLRLRLFLTPGGSPLINDGIVRRSAPGPEAEMNYLGIELLARDRASDTALRNYLKSRATA